MPVQSFKHCNGNKKTDSYLSYFPLISTKCNLYCVHWQYSFEKPQVLRSSKFLMTVIHAIGPFLGSPQTTVYMFNILWDYCKYHIMSNLKERWLFQNWHYKKDLSKHILQITGDPKMTIPTRSGNHAAISKSVKIAVFIVYHSAIC